MDFKFTNDRPIYLQIIEQIKDDLISNKLKPNEKMLSVRELAISANVNPNTMQKALQELEKEGLIITQRTVGRYVTNDVELIKNIKNDVAKKHTADYLNKMNQLGFSFDEIIKIIRENTHE